MARKMTLLVFLGLMFLPALAEQNESPAAIRAMKAGEEHLRRDEFEMAIKSFTRYAALEPERTHPYDLVACTYLKMGSLDLALKEIDRSHELDSNERTGFFANWLEGVALLRQGNVASADSFLTRAALASPSIAGQRIARARQNTDSLFGEDDGTEQTSEPYRLKLADLLLDECIDYQLFGRQ